MLRCEGLLYKRFSQVLIFILQRITLSVSLAEELNNLFARFKTNKHITPLSLSTPALTLQRHEVRQVLRTANPRKVAGPDGVPGKVLRACYNLYIIPCKDLSKTILSQIDVIIPVPKHHLQTA